MKKIFAAAAAIIGLSVTVAAAQMTGGGQGQQHPGGGMVGSQPSSQMMSGQMMTQHDMTHDMRGTMGMMEQVMQKMSRSMKGQMPIDRMQQMSQGMADMSVTLKEMSEAMAKGTMDTAAMKAMQDRMKKLNQTMDNKKIPVK